jgi:hypothetical protein
VAIEERGTKMTRKLSAVAALAATAALALVALAAAGRATTKQDVAIQSTTAYNVARQFVAAANRGDYGNVCRLYSTRYLKVSQEDCRSLYRWGAMIYGPYDYRIAARRRLWSGHWRIALIRWHHPSFIELARESAGWRIVAGGW